MAEIQHDTSHDGACPLWIEMLVQGELFPVAVSPPGIPAAVSLIRKIGLPRCCGREGWVRRGGKELGGQGRAAWAMWGGWAREAGVARWGGPAAAGKVEWVGGWGGGQTLAWAWMGRAGNAQGKAQQQGRLNPLPAATAFW